MGGFGYPDHVGVGEALVTGPNGAVAVFGAGTLVFNMESVDFGARLMDALYADQTARLGDAWVTVKQALHAGGPLPHVLEAYQLLGDPALSLGDAHAPRGGPDVEPGRTSYEAWLAWAFGPAWADLGGSTDPLADPDGDGLTNWEEYLAGTDPLNATSDLAVFMVRPLGDGRMELTWPSVPGRSYQIERATSVDGAYSVLAADLPAEIPVNTWIDEAAPTGAAFYRVLVR
jgi:hypothetical protein